MIEIQIREITVPLSGQTVVKIEPYKAIHLCTTDSHEARFFSRPQALFTTPIEDI